MSDRKSIKVWVAHRVVLLGVVGALVIAVIALGIVSAVAIHTKNLAKQKPPTYTSPPNTSLSTINAEAKTQTQGQTQTSPQTPSEAQLVSAWSQKYGYITTTISNDTSAISTDAGNNDDVTMSSDCQTFNSDLTTALSLPAIPDATAAAHFSSSLTYYQTSAEDCISGTRDIINGEADLDASLINQGASELEAAAKATEQGNSQTELTTKAIQQLSSN